MDTVVKWLIAAGAAGAGYAVASFGTKALTGKHIHNHVYGWYAGIRDKVAAFLRQNPDMVGSQIMMTILTKVDKGVNLMLQARDMVEERSYAGIRQIGNAITNFGIVKKANHEQVMEEEFSLDALPQGFVMPTTSAFNRRNEDVEEIEEVVGEVEVEPADNAQLKYARVAITAVKNEKCVQISEEDIPLGELLKMFPDVGKAAVGQPILIAT